MDPTTQRTLTCPRCSLRLDVSSSPPGGRATCSCGYAFVVPAPPMKAGRLGCPGCGAPVDIHLHACPYCRAPLATASCPRCFGMNFHGARHCTHCGEKLERAAVPAGEDTERECPRCRAPLEAHLTAGCRLESCEACGGVWLDTGTLERICEGREQAAALRRAALPHQPVERSEVTETAITYIPCPVCGAMMNRRNFGSLSGVIVDVCREHGTWFDKGEIRRCIEFVLSGGLAKAAERRKERLSEEITHLESMARSYGTHARAPQAALGRGTSLGLPSLEQGYSESFLVSLLHTLVRAFS